MITLKNSLFILALALYSGACFSQDDLLDLVTENKDEPVQKVYATFKTMRIGNAQTIETVKKKHLDFRTSHRFGNIYNADLPNPINTTGQTFLGFEGANDIRFSFDYGVTDDITIGIGRSRMNHIVDGSLKWKILKQTANFSMPISLAFFSSTGYTHDLPSTIYSGIVKDFETNELHRLNYFNQLIIASKINNWLSLEILPSYMHRNFIKEKLNTNNGSYDVNGFISIGFGGRIKLTKRLSFIGDYFYNVTPFYQNNIKAFNPLALGFEIETGGHVFSLFFTNAGGLIENNFIPYTTDSWAKGQVKFGFCISRTFAL
ncbi:MAG: DUF5777 family beta-barrel protein [Bacteroidota bacterium]|nr:DUF5777 family beta-barrel protein [Bacteroidota bacterium]MDP3147023.1 DUF5777 family beta-barrel protein [Bacteroidota bacterium]